MGDDRNKKELDETLAQYLSEPPPAPEPKKKTGISGTMPGIGSNPYVEGLRARTQNSRLVDCPYQSGTYDAMAWRKGWHDGT